VQTLAASVLVDAVASVESVGHCQAARAAVVVMASVPMHAGLVTEEVSMVSA
jgi:hypothetical protein